ncbi:MAG TPA: hypothetical protein VM865_05260 [Acidobacteriaceae bacterium]|jgi:hypothetical protein|nr:hypothetical protein [Acidobacteriaceae bacterium]
MKQPERSLLESFAAITRIDPNIPYFDVFACASEPLANELTHLSTQQTVS